MKIFLAKIGKNVISALAKVHTNTDFGWFFCSF